MPKGAASKRTARSRHRDRPDPLAARIGQRIRALRTETAFAFDAFVVRMAIVPAVLALLGAKAWWLPKWLDRALPNVDVEGESLAVHDRAADKDDEDKELVRA